MRVHPPADITVIVNTADDIRMHGLHVSPDLDSVMYALAGREGPHGWGLRDETWHVAEALAALRAETWFQLGDRDIATNLVRTAALAGGAGLAGATLRLTTAFGVASRLLPMSEDPVTTRIVTSNGVDLHFQEYLVRHRAEPAVRGVHFEGAAGARPGPGVLEAIAAAERLVVCPSNPVVSIGPILAVPGISDAIAACAAPRVAVSPIIAGAPVKGPADRLLAATGSEVSCVGVAALYRDLVDSFVIDVEDAERAGEIRALGLDVVVAPTLMHTAEDAAALAKVVMDA